MRDRHLVTFPLKVIWSCETLSQLESAERFCELWLERYEGLWDRHDLWLNVKHQYRKLRRQYVRVRNGDLYHRSHLVEEA